MFFGSIAYRLGLAAGLVSVVPLCAQVRFTKQPDRVAMEIDGQPYTTFYLAPGGNKPYVYPQHSLRCCCHAALAELHAIFEPYAAVERRASPIRFNPNILIQVCYGCRVR
jgi:hypothetical protein